MKLIIDSESCTSCGVCVKVCPQMVLEIPAKKEPVRAKNLHQCMGCFTCELECETHAIRLLRAPQEVQNIDIEPALDIGECDVAVVGAGPAGLGAAIACARGGLKVVVFDKLPNRRFSHHNDGGVMFTLPGLPTRKISKDKVELPEIGIALEGGIARKIDYIGLLGPRGLSTKNEFPSGIEGFIQNKHQFVNALADLAEKEGAKLWYNAHVSEVIKVGGRVAGLKLSSGKEVKAKVVVTADGVAATVTSLAGFPVAAEDLVYATALTYEFNEVPADLPLGYVYMLGDLEPADKMGSGYSGALGALAVVDTIHVGYGFMSTKRDHPAPKPLSHYLEQVIASDPRIKSILGSHLKGRKPDLISGCRTVYRKNHLTDHAIDGAVVVGDAWVDDGDLGNIPSLANGFHAGQVIVAAAKKSDFSRSALAGVNEFQSESVLNYITRSKREKLSPTVLSQKEMDVWFEFLPKMHYPPIAFGTPEQKKKALMAAFWGNFLRYFKLFKYRKLVPYLLS